MSAVLPWGRCGASVVLLWGVGGGERPWPCHWGERGCWMWRCGANGALLPGTATPWPPGAAAAPGGAKDSAWGVSGVSPFPGAASQLSPSHGDPSRARQRLYAMGLLSGLGPPGAPQPHGAVGTRAALRGGSTAPRKHSLVGAGGGDTEPGRRGPPSVGPAL